MNRRLVFRPRAAEDLASLFDYIAERSGHDRALSYLGRIEAACFGLPNFPERGTRRDDIAAGLRVVGFERRVSIAFRVLTAEVEIVAISYAGRDFEDELQGE